MRMNKHAKILDLVVLVVVVLFVWMNPFDIHLIKVVSAFRPKKPPANLPPGFFGTNSGRTPSSVGRPSDREAAAAAAAPTTTASAANSNAAAASQTRQIRAS